MFENGNGISLSELRDMLNQNENVVFDNSEIKLFITEFLATIFKCVIRSEKMNQCLCILQK